MSQGHEVVSLIEDIYSTCHVIVHVVEPIQVTILGGVFIIYVREFCSFSEGGPEFFSVGKEGEKVFFNKIY